LPEYELNKSF
jgi:NAD+-dependent protein deacetylase sirtuin 6